MTVSSLRNICIIAHVDHGKTTLVDQLLRLAGFFKAHEEVSERVLDSNDLEKERGITILSKIASVQWQGHKVNIVDTPGHADFGGEVERIMSMVDGAILLVDAVEGPLPQTRFVLEKSIKKGHKLILCINKVDRGEIKDAPEERINEVVNQVFDLCVELGASEDQLDFPIVYACAREGWCCDDMSQIANFLVNPKQGSIKPLLDKIIDCFPAPRVNTPANADDKLVLMQINDISWSNYLGGLGIGKIVQGTLTKNTTLFRIFKDADGKIQRKRFYTTSLLSYQGIKEIEVEQVVSGDIGIITSKEEVNIGDTISSDINAQPLPAIELEPPTLKMIFTINSSPYSGKDGDALQSRKLLERLTFECKKNMALKLEPSEQASDQFYILGRGELQFAILIETMRRENLEFMVGRPVIQLREIDGKMHEPLEKVTIQVPSDYAGEVSELFQTRRGKLVNYEKLLNNRDLLQFEIPTRNLLGIRSKFLSITRGEGLLSSELLHFIPKQESAFQRKNGTLVSDREGKTTDYALKSLEERGMLFIGGQVDVYEGMIVGEANTENDMNVNPVKPKKLTNIRSVSSDGLTMLSGIRKLSLEESIEWIDDDEWIECTPKTIRLRKKILRGNDRTIIRSKKK